MPETTEQRIPQWLTETPGDLFKHELILWDDGTSVQEVDLTRDEYIALKHRLAQLRGLEDEPRNRDIIPQSDIDNLRRLELALTTAVLSIRRRLAAGAIVEPGAWTITSDDPADIEEYAKSDTLGFSIAGLNVFSS